MLQIFVFGRIAITAGYWEQRGVDVETGARVEIRRVEHEDIEGAPAGVAGLRLMPVTEGIWRADLFRNQDGEVIYHYHPRFELGDVGERWFDDQLTADPVGFVIDRLRDLPALLTDSGAADAIPSVDLAEVERTLPAIRAAIERAFEPSATGVA